MSRFLISLMFILNFTGNENGTCVGMQTSRPVGLWQSSNCSATQPFVCQYLRAGRTLPTTTTTTAATTPIPCPDGWYGHGNKCYHVSEKIH